jgi:hypothetical protein
MRPAERVKKNTYLCLKNENIPTQASHFNINIVTQLVRLSTTNINVNIDTLVSENRHPQTSHFFCTFAIF